MMGFSCGAVGKDRTSVFGTGSVSEGQTFPISSSFDETGPAVRNGALDEHLRELLYQSGFHSLGTGLCFRMFSDSFRNGHMPSKAGQEPLMGGPCGGSGACKSGHVY